MDTTVWTFLIIVVICSIAGYFFLKRYSNYYNKRKTDRIIEEFMRANQLEMSDKSFEAIERELLLEEERYDHTQPKKVGPKTTHAKTAGTTAEGTPTDAKTEGKKQKSKHSKGKKGRRKS